jgi:nucleoid DNA-binding protein
MAKAKAKALTKSALYAHLAEASGLKKSEVVVLMDALYETIKTELSKKDSAGSITLPGIAKVKVRKVDAVKGGVKKINPLTGSEYVTKDKPAYRKVSILAVKSLKDALK